MRGKSEVLPPFLPPSCHQQQLGEARIRRKSPSWNNILPQRCSRTNVPYSRRTSRYVSQQRCEPIKLTLERIIYIIRCSCLLWRPHLRDWVLAMKPPDVGGPLFTVLLLLVLCLCQSWISVDQLAEAARIAPSPPLLNIHVPRNAASHAATSRVDASVTFKSSVIEVEPYDRPSPVVRSPDEVVTLTSVQVTVAESNAPSQVEATTPREVHDEEEVVTKTSVEGSIAVIGAQDEQENTGESSVDEAVTRTSLRVSGVELGANGEVVSAMPEQNLQDAVTQTSIRFSQQELEQQENQPERSAANKTSTDVNANAKTGVENIQELLKQIQNEVGEARILYVADPKAKKGDFDVSFF